MAEKFQVEYDDHALLQMVRALTDTQKLALRQKYSQSYIADFIHQIREEIAIQAVTQIRAKVNLTFTAGYGGRGGTPLVESIYYKFDDNDDVYISSNNSVLDILNAGYDSFDMKEKLAGRTVPLRLPGGRIIYRKVDDLPAHRTENLNPNYRTKKNKQRKFYSTKNWIHPGYQGKHIYKLVAQEMKPWVEEFIRERVYALLQTLDVNPYTQTKDGNWYYDFRNANGRFSTFE